MVKLYDSGVYLLGGTQLLPEDEAPDELAARKAQAKQGTIAYGILQAHNHSGDPEKLKIKFDAITSHDLTYVGIIQTARASGLEKFPLPYVLTCCHNSLCAVGGTINEDDHVFGLTACKKYGGIYVPPHIAVIHQYMRETMAGGGKMILGSDSHTRYGALGTMAVGEGGGELVKQILEQTWDAAYPEVVAVYLDGKPRPGVGPQDIAIALVSAVFKNGFVKNKVLEFVGPGVGSLSTDYRNGVDVMTTETTCLSSVWRTDEDTRAWLTEHGRPEDYQKLDPAETAYYDGCVYIDLSTVRSMIALPFHPSNGYEIRELNENMDDILHLVEEDARSVAATAANGGRITALFAKLGANAGCASPLSLTGILAKELSEPLGYSGFSLHLFLSTLLSGFIFTLVVYIGSKSYKVKADNPLKWSEIPKFNRNQKLTMAAIIMSSYSASKETTNEEMNKLFKNLFLLSVANVAINVLMAALGVFSLGGLFY